MQEVTLKSKSKHKIKLLVELAKELGVEVTEEHDVTDEQMSVPGYKPSKKQIEMWLAKEDGESYSLAQAREITLNSLKKKKKKTTK